MLVWIGILVLTFGISVGSLIFLRSRGEGSAAVRNVSLGLLAAAAAATVGFGIKLPLNAVVIPLHLGVFFVGTECADGVFGAVTKKKRRGVLPVLAAAILGCFVYLLVGYVSAHTVRRAEVRVETAKALPGDGLRIVLLSDVHLGTTMDEEDFAKLLQRIADEKPDIVAVAGDLIDGNTKQESMIRACEAFAGLTAVCDVYFTDGNHELGDDSAKVFENLHGELLKYGVKVLCDEVVLTDDGYYVVGRRDRSEARESIAKLTAGLEADRFCVLLDHQPNDFDAESGAADLVLCGHTHGGFLLPVPWVAPFISGFFDADRFSGTEIRGTTNFVVSAGAGTWGISFKTGAWSDYTVIEVK